MANTDNITFDVNYFLSEKPADGYYISSSNYLSNHEPKLLTQPNSQFFKSRENECEIKFFFEDHNKFYRPDIFCPFNLNGTGTPSLKFRLQLSKSTSIPILTCHVAASQGATSLQITSTDMLTLDSTHWITINGESTQYYLAQQYQWVGGDAISVDLVDEVGSPLSLEYDVNSGDDIYHNKLGDTEDDIVFDKEYNGVLPIYPWGEWTPYSLTIPWGGYDASGKTEQFIATIADEEYLSSASVYCGKLTITGGVASGLALMRLFIGQATIKNAYLEKPFESIVNFVDDQAIDEINVRYNSLNITVHSQLLDMAKTVVSVGDDVLLFIQHAERNYVYAGFIPKSELKLTLKDSVRDCEAKYLNEWDCALKIISYP